MSDRREQLLAIDGVGEATADKIMAVVGDDDTDRLHEALACIEADRPGVAHKHIRRYLGE